MVASLRSPRDTPIRDHTRERVTSLNQLLFSAVALVVCALLVLADTRPNPDLFLAGIIVVFVAAGMALVVPWSRVPVWWGALLPLLDFIAVGLLRESAPGSSLGLLWILPAVWLSAEYGLRGYATSIVTTLALSIWLLFAGQSEFFILTAVMLMLVITTASTMTYLTARRAGAQRLLLRKQSRMLEGALARARRQEMTVSQVLDAVDFGVIRFTADGEISMMNVVHGRLQIWDRPSDGDQTDAAGLLRLVPMFDDAGGERTAYQADGITTLAPEDLPSARALLGEAIENQVMWFGRPGAQRRALSVTVRRLRDAEGNDDGAVLVSRDVTAELSAIRAREDLVASVSHELRTPLTSILGYIELVLEDDLPPSSRRGLEIAGRNANRLLAIVADILAASSRGGAQIQLSIEPTDADLADIARASVEAFEPRAAEQHITIHTDAIESAMAHVDPARLRQVVDNLVSNAIKYNREGGEIDISCTADGRNAWLVVRDTGVGISAEELPRLFERFFRAESVRNTSTHGSGLGLSISREIVRLHHGEITVTSALGEGTTMVVRVPVHPRRQDIR